jgi:ABC-type glycerol-3-phosphate transport system permease component
MKARKILKKIVVYMLILGVCAIAVMPFVWMVSTSFKNRSEIFTYPPVLIPRDPTLTGYTDLAHQDIFGNAGFLDFLKNSVFVSLTTATVTVAMASLAGYSLSRFKFTGSRTLRYIILLGQMMPGALLLIPLYLLMTRLNLLDKHLSLILAYTSFTLPYATYIIRGYFESIPTSLDEAALVDGCNRVTALFRVVFPLAAPGIVVTFTSSFIMAWNEFMFALVFLNNFQKWTLPLALGSFRGQYLVEWGYLFAGATLVTLPVLILFLFLQKWIASGYIAGAIK